MNRTRSISKVTEPNRWSRRRSAKASTFALAVGAALVAASIVPAAPALAADGTAPSAPGNLHTLSVGSTAVRLGWSASTDDVGVVGYDVYKWATRIDGTKSSLSITLTGLTANRDYTFSVRARDAAGNRSSASTITVHTSSVLDTTPPSAPTNVTVLTKTDTSVRLSWTAATDNVAVTGYDVIAGGSRVTGTSGATTVTVTGLKAGTTYVFTIRAKDANANVGPASSSISVMTTGGIVTPALLDAHYSVTREGAYGNKKYTVYRPSTPSSVPWTLPVVVFGNGACAHNNNSETVQLLTSLSSHGIVVVAEGSVDGSSTGVADGTAIPSLLTDAITWAQGENARSGAALAGHLDLTKVATDGHSCGGLESLAAGGDTRVGAVISLDSGFFADGSFGLSRSLLNNLHTPVLFMDGGSSDIAYDNSRANYGLVTKVPAILAEHSQAGHGGFITGSQMSDGVMVQVQFLSYALYGDTTARTYLTSSSGLAARANWSVQSKNFPSS